jgi:hypothetical protein
MVTSNSISWHWYIYRGGINIFMRRNPVQMQLQKNGGTRFGGFHGSKYGFLRFAARLPAAVSAASPAAITAVAIPASATSAAATSAAWPPSAATAKAAAATATARPSSPATAATLTRRPRFVDDNIAAHEIVAV